MLEVNNLRMRFGGITAVNDVSFTVGKGEVVSLIGPNGAGKTTCFNMISGFLKPTEGSAAFEGETVTGKAPHDIARRGVVRSFQKTNILKNLTVFENILAAHHRQGTRSLWATLFPGKGVRQSEAALRDSAADIVELIGLGARMNTEAASLSCGELRLLEVGIGLGAKPRLLMLDEPAAGLNSEEAIKLGAILKQLVGSQIEALLLVEHNMNLVMSISDRIVVMNFGLKLAEGGPEDIRSNPEVIAAYLGSATGH
ncbi:ABC transporter ATP-binding protein [Ferrovibrio sp.]|uniref:ABC transporter ATP-binding protein n=1 Tax=Ferrovibrio sp. TaxID=1917215 RepID=UPI001B738843|nr:ABC transporter ATP-binding protein [Ferrovibrio sp.]MBP7064850.1 ABC transporter ATP-binding protein [Ferrovibrio sp.]